MPFYGVSLVLFVLEEYISSSFLIYKSNIKTLRMLIMRRHTLYAPTDTHIFPELFL